MKAQFASNKVKQKFIIHYKHNMCSPDIILITNKANIIYIYTQHFVFIWTFISILLHSKKAHIFVCFDFVFYAYYDMYILFVLAFWVNRLVVREYL